MAIADRLNQITKKDNGASAPVNKEPTPKVDTSAKRDQFISKAQQKRETYQANRAPVQQPVNQPQNGISNRSNFKTDDEYEKYIVGNKLNATTGDAYEYISQKAKEQGIHPRQYFEGMRNRYKDATETEKFREGINSGKYGEKEVEEINNRFGVLLDENGNEADVDKYNSDTDLIGRTAENIQKAFQKNEKDYTSGKIDYQTYANENNRLVGLQEENNAKATSLQNYKALNGFDYYDWAKENGKDVSDFESYVESMNDWWPERLAEEWTASWVDTLNILPQTYNVLAQVIDPNYDSSKSAIGSLSDNLSQTSQELREYVFAGADAVSEWSLQCLGSLMPMINSMMVGKLLPVNTEVFTNVSLGLSSGVETTKQRLQEGVNPGTAVLNGVLHGVITGMVEGLNMGEIPLLFSGVTGAYMAKVGLMQFAGSAVFKEMMTTAINEGKEEIFETLLDWGVDNIQNMILGSIDGNRINATELDPAEMANEFIMASVGTVALGIPTNISILVDTKRRYNGAMEARKHFESVINNELAMPEERELAKKAIEVIDYSVKPFEEASQIAKAVDLPEDMVTPAPTYNQMINNLANAIQPDVSTQLATAEKTLQYANKVQNQLQEALIERNIFMPASEFINMDPQTRAQYLELGKQLSESGREAWFADLGEGVNGYNSANRTFINTRQTGTIDVDSLANMDEKAFNDIIKNDVQQIFEEAGAEASAVSASVHEFTHFAEQSGKWSVLRDYVKEQMGVDRFNTLVDRIGKIYDAHNIKGYNAEHEAVAYYIQKNMGNMDFLKRLVSYDNSLFNRLATRTKNFFSGDTQSRMEQVFMDAFRGAKDNLESAGTPAYSIGSTFQAINMEIEKRDGMIEAYINGEKVDRVTKEHVERSALGNLMRVSVRNGFLTTQEASDQMQMYADMCNAILKTQDPDLLWAISGSLGYQPIGDGTIIDETKSTKSSAFTSNADKQYNRTFDVTTICNKTQQVINVMSKVMMELNRGLTEEEIVKIVYDETNKAGEPVPCPVCYVFSRWVGVGGLLDNIKNYQIEYANADVNDLQKRYNALSKQVDEIVKRNNITVEVDEDVDEKTKKKMKGTKAREILDKQLNEEYNALLGRQNTFMLLGKELSAKDKQRLSDLEKDIAILDRWSWIGKVRLSPNYKPVPSDVLFDMNKGEEFANDYPETWGYRTTRGPAMGKAITPYTSEVLGQTVMGFSGSPSNMKKLGDRRSERNNPLLKDNWTKPAENYVNKAIQNARAQNLIGGSRAQSTSDFRFEYVLDYLLHFMELQSIGSYGQTYTKVPEAVALLASVNYEVNMSIMAKGFGYKEVPKGTKGARELDGKWYVLEFSDKTGMNAEDAFRLASMYNNAQPIMVGINDIHMRLCMADPRITFIIPYHASGANEQRYLDLMRAVGEDVSKGARRDYSNFQNDKEIENPTSRQKSYRKARMDIIMGKATSATRELVQDNEILRNLYDRFYVKGVDDDCYHNFLKKEQAKQIFPYEYWDKTTTIDTADVNGKAFADYCESLGMVPRFNEFKGESGYWKLLIDRSMYNLDGTYHEQQAINMNDFNTDFLYRDKMVEGIVQPSQVMDSTKTEGIVNNVLGRIGQYSLGQGVSDDNYGYHYGAKNLDLNRKSETLWQRSGRGTGAFGTGTYFFGNGRFQSSYSTDPRKTEHKVDFSKYNLFKPNNADDGYRLHRIFKGFDDSYSYNGAKSVEEIKQRVSNIVDALNEIEYSEDGEAIAPSELVEDVRNQLLEIGEDEDYVDKLIDNNTGDNGVWADYLADDLKELFINEDDWRRSPRSIDRAEDYENIMSRIPELAKILGEDEDYIYDVVNEAMRSAEADTYKRDFFGGNYDSVGTRIMKKLGYQGIDVRNIEGLDNSTYGSVIYDLQPDTIQYSLGARRGLNNLRQYVLNNPGSQYETQYNNMEKRLQEAEQMFNQKDADGNRVYTDDEIYEKTGWLLDPNDPDKLKVEFYDDGTVNKIRDYVKNNKGASSGWNSWKTVKYLPTLSQLFGEDSLLFAMYPGLKDVRLVVTSKCPKRTNPDGTVSYTKGRHYSWTNGEKCILVSKRLYNGSPDFDDSSLQHTIAHEIQHFIQETEGFKEDGKSVPYPDRVEEKEAEKVGFAQENGTLRRVDEYGNIISDGNSGIPELHEESNTGDVDADESEGSADGAVPPGELEDSDGLSGEEGSAEGDGVDDIDGEDPGELEDNIIEDDEGDEEDPASIKRGGPEQKKPTWERFVRWVRHHIGDHLDAVEDLARRAKNRKIIAKADTAMNFRAIANNTILNGRYNLLSKNGSKIGESLSDILNSIPKGLEEDFDYYMYHYRNMDSTSLRERMGLEYMADKFLKDNHLMNPDGTKMTGEQFAKVIEEMEKTLTPEQLAGNPVYSAFSNFAKAKYVFGTSKIGYNESKQFVEDMEAKHPEFKKIAERIWEYGRMDLQVLRDAGIISQDDYDMFLSETPHYVPIARDIDTAKFEGKYKLDPNKAIRRFKGSTRDMWSLEYALINHTYNVYRSALTNNLHQEIYDTLKPKKQTATSENVEDIINDNHTQVEKMKDGTYRMYAYINGKRRMVKIDEDLYNSLSPRRNNFPDIPLFTTISEIRRNLITSWNPVFYATNAIKDVQDALYNTKYFWSFGKNYIKAWNQILSNGEYKQMYLRNGGEENSYMHELNKKDVGWKPLKNLIAIGDAIELAPRMAEFISSIEAGNSIEEAMLDASEITTNFKRGGDIAKTINRNGVTFFNASVQGFNKQVRNFKDARDGGAKAMATYMARIAFLSGIPLFLLNHLVWKDDDDYEGLSDYIKENYYIIGKVGNRFIRIPKGRLASFYQTAMTKGGQTLSGQVKAWDALMDVVQSGIDNIAPNNPTDNFIGSPLIQAYRNKTWYGDDLVPSRLQKYPDEEQYDYSTDVLSIFLGQKLKISPYKINYVLDQYSGGIGDIGLPMLSLQANNGINDKALASLLSPVLDKFTTDPVMKAQAVSSFYELKDATQKLSNSKNATDEQVLSYKYLSAVGSEIGELYTKMREIQADPNLSNGEKYAQVRELKEQINQSAQEALASYDSIDINGGFADVGGVYYRRNAEGGWSKVRDTTLKKINEYGLSDEEKGQYFDSYYDIENARDEVKANTPEGENADYRQATIDAIRNSNMDAKAKNAMFDSYYSGKFSEAVNAMDLSDDEKLEIKFAKTMAEGTKDANGKTIANSKAQAVADAYRELGVLDDVLKYISDNDIAPSVMGLSKTVYNQLIRGGSYKSSGSKSSSKSSKKASSAKSGGGGSTGIRKAGKLAMVSSGGTTAKPTTSKIDNYFKAYANVFNRSSGGRKVSTGGSSASTCPRCGSRVPSGASVCPVCGQRL